MKANIKLIQKKRRYSEEFKKEIVKDFERGKYSVPQLERLHGIGNAQIYRWIYKFSTFNEKGHRIVEMHKSSSAKVRELQKRVEELERAVGQKQIKIDFLEKLIEVAQEEYNIDIKKKSFTPRSPGSGKTMKS
jgi:transposase-like protein